MVNGSQPIVTATQLLTAKRGQIAAQQLQQQQIQQAEQIRQQQLQQQQVSPIQTAEQKRQAAIQAEIPRAPAPVPEQTFKIQGFKGDVTQAEVSQAQRLISKDKVLAARGDPRLQRIIEALVRGGALSSTQLATQTKAITELGGGSFVEGAKIVKQQQAIVEQFGDLAKVDVSTLTPTEFSRFEAAKLIVTTPAAEPTFLETLRAQPKTFQEIVAAGGTIGRPTPTPTPSFKDRVIKFGLATAFSDVTGELFAESERTKQTNIDFIRNFINEKTGVDIPTFDALKIRDIIIQQQTGTTEQQIKDAEIATAQIKGAVAPFLIPGLGGILGVAFGTEAFVTEGGKERIKQTKEVLEESGLPPQLAFIPPALAFAGGAFQIFSEIKALNQISALGKVGDEITTNVASPNVKRTSTTKILNSLDDETLAVINKNKLTAGRVYETTIGTGKNARKIQFLEFGKGKVGTQGFEGSRILFGVEIRPNGNIISTIGGVTIEKGTEKGISRSITNLVRNTVKRGRFTASPIEEQQFFTFLEDTRTKSIDAGDFIVTGGKSEITLFKKTGKLSKVDPSDLAINADDAQKLKDFFAGKDVNIGKPTAEAKIFAIEKGLKGDVNLIGTKTDDFIGISAKGQTTSVEAGKILTTDVKLKAPPTSGTSNAAKLKNFRNRLSVSGKKGFDKLNKIDQLFFEGQFNVNQLNSQAGLSLGQINKQVLLEVRRIGGASSGLRASSSPSGIPGAIAKITTPTQSAISKSATKIFKAVTGVATQLKAPKAETSASLNQNIAKVNKVGLKQTIKSQIKQTEITATKLKQQVGVDSVLDLSVKPKTAQQIKQKLEQQIKVKQTTRQKQQTAIRQKFRSITPQGIPKGFVPPVVLPIPNGTRKRVRTALGVRKQTRGWVPMIKQRGRFKKFTKPFKSKQQAINFARWLVDNSTSRQYKVLPRTSVKKFSQKRVPHTIASKFRTERIRNKRRFPLPNLGGIEKTKFAIDTRNEKLELRASRAFSKRFPKRKKFKIPRVRLRAAA